MTRRLVASLVCALLMSLAIARAAETEDYEIENYEVTFETKAASASVGVTMDITYLIKSGTKSTGFKYVGDYKVEQLSGRDGEGRPIKTWVEQQRETRINWSFSPAGRGKKRVIVSFTIPGAITKSAKANEFKADWAGIFRVVVKRATYRFVFPDSGERTVITRPSQYGIVSRNNRRAIEIAQAPLGTPAFHITFWPSIVDSTVASYSSADGKGKFSWGGITLIPLLFFGFMAFVIWRLVVAAKRANPEANRWWASGSSCSGGDSGGGSSCGSSCGGGGCGGGCGG